MLYIVRKNVPNMVNSADPKETPPLSGVLSGSMLFVNAPNFP